MDLKEFSNNAFQADELYNSDFVANTFESDPKNYTDYLLTSILQVCLFTPKLVLD